MGSCLTHGNELSEEIHMLTKRETLLGRGARAESSRVREPRRTALPHKVSGFMAIGLVSGLSLVNHSDSGNFLVARASLSQDDSREDSGRLVGHKDWRLLSPLNFPEFFLLVVAY